MCTGLIFFVINNVRWTIYVQLHGYCRIVASHNIVLIPMIKKKDNKKFKRNLKKEEWIAINTLRRNENIVIKPADKGGNVVIMNKEDYIQEGLRQLSDHDFYEELEEDPTQNYNNLIYQVLHQAANLNIIDDKK